VSPLVYVSRGMCCVIATAAMTVALGASAGEVLDNTKVNNMIKKGVSLDVILKLMEPSVDPSSRVQGTTFRFDASSEAIISIQEAANEGKWTKEDAATLQKKITELAKKDEKLLKELVDRALNIFDNADPNEYELMMRTISREGKRIIPYLLVKTSEESERKRGGIIDAIGRIGDKSENVVREATNMLFDRSKPVRAQAAKAVVTLIDDTTAKELIGRLNSRTEKLDGVATALGYLGNMAAVEPLTKLLKNSGDSDTRICAAFALGELRAKNKETVEALLSAILDEHDEKLRETAATAVAAKLGDKRAPGHIIQAFHRYRTGRAELIKPLSYIKDLAALDFLVEQVENDDPRVKKAAHETLVLLTGEDAKDSEEWRGIITVIRGRPDWIQTHSPRVPDAKRDREGALRNDGNETTPTALR